MTDLGVVGHPVGAGDRQQCPNPAIPAALQVGGEPMNKCPELGSGDGRLNVRVWVGSDLGAFGKFKSILHVDAQVAHRAVNLGMAEEDLNGAEIASRLVDDRCLRAPE